MKQQEVVDMRRAKIKFMRPPFVKAYISPKPKVATFFLFDSVYATNVSGVSDNRHSTPSKFYPKIRSRTIFLIYDK